MSDTDENFKLYFECPSCKKRTEVEPCRNKDVVLPIYCDKCKKNKNKKGDKENEAQAE